MFQHNVGRMLVAVPANFDGYPEPKDGTMLVTESLNPVRPTTIATVRPPADRRRWRRAPDAVTAAPAVVHFTWANRRPGTAGFARWAACVGQRIDEHGLAATAREVDNIVAVARGLDVAPIAVDVLADPTQAEPARCRAFAHVVSALLALSGQSLSVAATKMSSHALGGARSSAG
jgi:hypothetical protein